MGNTEKMTIAISQDRLVLVEFKNKTKHAKNVCVMIDDCNSNVFFYLFRFLIQVKSYKGFAMTVGHR